MNQDIRALSEKILPIFEAESNIGFVYLFGSRARGAVHAKSDYDFAVYFNEADSVRRHEILYRITAEISRALQIDAIDAHSLNDIASPELKYNIVHEGVLLFERQGFRLIIEPRILNEYFDFMYLLRKYNLTKT